MRTKFGRAIPVERNCETCGTVFLAIKAKPTRFCSRACYSKSDTAKENGKRSGAMLVGRPSNNPFGNGGACKGRKATPQQLEGLRVGWEMPKAPITEETRRKMSDARKGRFSEEQHPLWKGDQVGYGALHVWIARRFTRPDACEHCGQTDRKFHWAMVHGTYSRTRCDWLNLCIPCHWEYDRRETLDRAALSKAGKKGAATKWAGHIKKHG